MITTTDNEETTRRIADSLVKKKLSPCVQIVPQIESIYAWHGKIQNSNEFLIIIKTMKNHLDECKNVILELHNYDIPEIIVSECEILLDAYSDWFIDNSSL